MFTTIYILLIATFIVRSMYRNYEWVNEDRLFKSALHVCPLNAKVHYNIAKGSVNFLFNVLCTGVRPGSSNIFDL